MCHKELVYSQTDIDDPTISLIKNKHIIMSNVTMLQIYCKTKHEAVTVNPTGYDYLVCRQYIQLLKYVLLSR